VGNGFTGGHVNRYGRHRVQGEPLFTIVLVELSLVRSSRLHVQDRRRRGEGVIAIHVDAKPGEVPLGVREVLALVDRLKNSAAIPRENVPQRVCARYADHMSKGTRNNSQDPRGVVVNEERSFNSQLLRDAKRVHDCLTGGGGAFPSSGARHHTPPDRRESGVLVVHRR
jgi:hypothetical protein